jgi:carboxymethylenebutenolidase
MSMLNIKAADGGLFKGYIALPQKQPAPGVVVLQEIFGINDFVRETTDALAQSGFVALAPDLFWRRKPGVELHESQREEGQSYLKSMSEPLAVTDSISAMQALRAHPACNGRVGAVGYCWGGKLAYLMAARSNVDAAVSFYGVGLQAALAEVANIHAPLLVHLADADILCPPPAQEQIIAAMRQRADHISIEVYEGAGHAFARRGGKPFMAIHAERANGLTSAFLIKHLHLEGL